MRLKTLVGDMVQVDGEWVGIGDVVRRREGAMRGVVQSFVAKPHHSGSSSVLVTVLWESGATSTHPDQQLRRVDVEEEAAQA